MSLYNDFKKYRDRWGFNQLTTNGVEGDISQNGALFTMEYLICLLGDPNTSLTVKQQEITRLSVTYPQLEKFPGVTSRTPNGTEFDSMDNAGASLTFSAMHDSGKYANRSYEHGLNTVAHSADQTQDPDKNNKWFKWVQLFNLYRPRWFWNCNNPTLWCMSGWHGRSPAFLAYIKMAAGKRVGPIGTLSVLIGQFLGCFEETGNTDARKLPYVNWQFLKNRSKVWNLFYKLWCFILMRQYPNGMRDVYSIYYRDPNHPIRAYSKPFEP